MTPIAAYAALSSGAPLEPFEIDRRAVGPTDVQIDIKFCGICHSDIHQANEDWDTALCEHDDQASET